MRVDHGEDSKLSMKRNEWTARFRGILQHDERLKKMEARLMPINFITLHYTYFILTCLVCSIVFWLTSRPAQSVSYIDSLFLVTSAMTEAGLNTVNLSQLNTFQQLLLWLLIICGSTIFVSISTVFARKRAFEKRLRILIAERRRKNEIGPSEGGFWTGGNVELPVHEQLQRSQKPAEPLDMSDFESRHSCPRDPANRGSKDPVSSKQTTLDHEVGGAKGETGQSEMAGIARYSRPLGMPELGSRSLRTHYSSQNGTSSQSHGKQEDEREAQLDDLQYPDYLTRHNTGRNAQFFGLTKAERDHLGGVEYRAISLLAWIVPIYFVSWQLFGCLGLAAYFALNKANVALSNGMSPWWLGVFCGASAFNNSGMSLLDMNMIPFRTAPYPLITMGIMILAGNTAYPLFLRLIFWTMLKVLCLTFPSDEKYASLKATIRFILRYPRRVYTNLFPSQQTWWLLFMLIVLNGTDWAAFELLNIGNTATDVIPARFRVLDGLFQALAVRSGGFYIIAIPSLRIGLQVLYVIMMYISVYPVTITMRHSNVYEERSLGIYADDDYALVADKDECSASPRPTPLKRGIFNKALDLAMGPFSTTPHYQTSKAFIAQQVHGQLAHDIWYLILAILVISCIEGSNFERDPVTFSVFNIAFEVVSGYGCVGISTGVKDDNFSFSGDWKVASKVLLCAVMVRGRHRGLPVALDRAVRLPVLDVGAVEEEDIVKIDEPRETSRK